MEKSGLVRGTGAFLAVWLLLSLTFLIYILVSTKGLDVHPRNCDWINKGLDSFLGYGDKYSSQTANGIKTCAGAAYTSSQRGLFVFLVITLGSLVVALTGGMCYLCVIVKGKRSSSGHSSNPTTVTVSYH